MKKKMMCSGVVSRGYRIGLMVVNGDDLTPTTIMVSSEYNGLFKWIMLFISRKYITRYKLTDKFPKKKIEVFVECIKSLVFPSQNVSAIYLSCIVS